MTYDFNENRKSASEFTERANQEMILKLDFDNCRDYELTERGFIAT